MDNNNNGEERKSLRDSFWESKWVYVIAVLGVLAFLIQIGQSDNDSDSRPSSESEYYLNDEENLQDFLDWKEKNGTGWSDN